LVIKMTMYEIIQKKRDGYMLDEEEIEFFINGYVRGEIPDYQVSALLMAIFINGMDKSEIPALTLAMARSGDRVDLSSINGIKVDKHSTGGVGDKTTLVVAPIVAACGVPVAKMSGKGLGHTGGTIDKLDSIPGFNTSIPIEDFLSNVRNVGLAIAGQTGNLAPADKKLYALRDVTATVNNTALIASSIMSKKIAAGADAVVLDVKTGDGAFMKTEEEAVNLAKTMIEIGRSVGLNTAALISDMDTPLGYSIGNSLEVIEAIEILKNRGPEDLRAICIELAGMMLYLAKKGTYEACKHMAMQELENGGALKKFKQLIESQGGNSNIIDDYTLFSQPKYSMSFVAKEKGYISKIWTEKLGRAAMTLGAGRATKDSLIDYSAGIILKKKIGDKVETGECIAELYSSIISDFNEAISMLDNVFEITSELLGQRESLIKKVII